MSRSKVRARIKDKDRRRPYLGSSYIYYGRHQPVLLKTDLIREDKG